MSSIVRRTPATIRALIARRDATPAPRVLTLDADAAVLLAVDATRGMLDAYLRGQEQGRSGQVEVAASAPAAAAREAPAEVSAAEPEACPAWRASQVRRAYLSTLPPPSEEPAHGCDRWA